MHRSLRTILLLLALLAPRVFAADASPEMSPEQRAFVEKLEALDWVNGPTTVDVSGNSKLVIPEGYRFLDARNTDKFLELTRNLSNGDRVLLAPKDLSWTAYLSFADEGYVKDDEKIDATELLKAMKAGEKDANAERRRRGYPELEILDWAIPPAYNTTNKRLEWATRLRSDGIEDVNFSTKLLGRRGHTSVILVAAPEDLTAARSQLETVLGGFSFNEGERYADWVPGDKVATYGLAALVLGGAAAVAAKKGLFAALIGFIVAKIKLVIAGIVALGAAIKKFLFGKKTDDAG